MASSTQRLRSPPQHLVGVIVSNVADPPFPLYLMGARLVEAFPVPALAGNVPLGVGVLSYDGQLNVGLQCDPDGYPALNVLADGLRRSLDVLAAALPRPVPG